MATSESLKTRVWTAPFLLAISILFGAQALSQEAVTDQETELGLAAYEELRDKVEIIESSPLYDRLNPVAEAITRVAQPRYEHPFKFFLVHETRPNAFATPGGNVYVVDSLLYFVKNTEQLAGTLCHEVSHTIHHDAMNRIKKEEKIIAGEIGAALLLGPTLARVIAIKMIGDLNSLAYSREVESQADLTGSDICAQAGYNPWGLVWLFRNSKTPTLSTFRNFCPTIRPTQPGCRPFSSTFATDLRCFPGSTRIRLQRPRLACRKTFPWYSCVRKNAGTRLSSKYRWVLT